MEQEGIYLLREREFARLNENVYKIGKSVNVKNRTNAYPKGSDIELAISCKDSLKCERQLLEIFKKTFIQRTEYGREYFEGDKQKMIAIITNELHKINGHCNGYGDTYGNSYTTATATNANANANVNVNKIQELELQKQLTSVAKIKEDTEKTHQEATKHLVTINITKNELFKAKQEVSRQLNSIARMKEDTAKSKQEAAKHLATINITKNELFKAKHEVSKQLTNTANIKQEQEQEQETDKQLNINVDSLFEQKNTKSNINPHTKYTKTNYTNNNQHVTTNNMNDLGNQLSKMFG